MGYYTRFELSVLGDTEVLLADVDSNRVARIQVLHHIASMPEDSYMRHLIYFEEDGGPPVDFIEHDMKWYGYKDDMYQLSKRFPSLLFCLEGRGEDTEDHWKEYWLNGMVQHTRARVLFDDPHPDNMTAYTPKEEP